MPYTIGIKRRWFPGYRKVSVTGHDWQNWRFILNLADGSQEHLPGFGLPSLKVYPDFWAHLAQEKAKRLETVARPSETLARQGATQIDEPARPLLAEREPEPEKEPVPEDPLMTEARKRATQRVYSILGGDGA